MMLLVCLEGSGFFGIDPLRAAAENAAFVIGVVELGAGWADTAAYEQKKFCSNQHTESGGQEIDPKGMPIPPSAQTCPAGLLTVPVLAEAAGRLMQSFCILYSSEVRFIPSRSAAPFLPPTTQLLASSARRM